MTRHLELLFPAGVTGSVSITTAPPIVLRSSQASGQSPERIVRGVEMDITERIQMLLSKARHPSCTPDRRLELRAQIQILQIQRENEEIRKAVSDEED